MTCKDCLHYEVCAQFSKADGANHEYYTYANQSEKCECFRDKSESVPEIVRCADCRYWDAVKNPKHKDTGICAPPRKDLGGYCVRRGATNCNDYCGQGKRRANNAEIH